MSGLLGLLLVSISVGLSNFAGAMGIGMSGISARTRLRVGIAFGLFEALMPIAGLLLGQAVAGYLGHIAKYVGSAILILVGAYTIWQGRRVTSGEPRPQPERTEIQTHSLIITAPALSIDNLAVGFALSVYHIQIGLAAGAIRVISVARSPLPPEPCRPLVTTLEAQTP